MTLLYKGGIKEGIVQFMFGLHWLVNYTDIDTDMVLNKLTKTDRNYDGLKEYLFSITKNNTICGYDSMFDFGLFI